MTIKTKLSLGLGFLFLIIFALAAFCSNHVGKLAKETDNILKDNYNSLVYSRNMISALEDMKNSISSTLFAAVMAPMRSCASSACRREVMSATVTRQHFCAPWPQLA